MCQQTQSQVGNGEYVSQSSTGHRRDQNIEKIQKTYIMYNVYQIVFFVSNPFNPLVIAQIYLVSRKMTALQMVLYLYKYYISATLGCLWRNIMRLAVSLHVCCTGHFLQVLQLSIYQNIRDRLPCLAFLFSHSQPTLHPPYMSPTKYNNVWSNVHCFYAARSLLKKQDFYLVK